MFCNDLTATVGNTPMMELPRAKARTAYQDFLSLWQDADDHIPILNEAKSDYEKLRGYDRWQTSFKAGTSLNVRDRLSVKTNSNGSFIGIRVRLCRSSGQFESQSNGAVGELAPGIVLHIDALRAFVIHFRNRICMCVL
jgi:hypothetical protein